MLAIDWHAAKVQWKFAEARSSQPIRSCPAVSEELVVFGSRSKKVYAVDRMTGKQQWVFPTRARIDSSPVIVGDRVFIGGGDGRVYALNLKDGQKRWEYETGSGFVGGAAVADGRLVIANDGGVIYCFGESQ
jgi:outer membrane protein assembly factor BamB